MKILNYNYIKRHHFIALAIILILTSTLFSITAFGFMGIYRSLNSYLGQENNIITIYDKQSQTPFTGIVPIGIIDRLDTITGIIESSPEIVIPCNINNNSIFLRGILPTNFEKLNPLPIIVGKPFNLNETNSALLGKRLAEKLNLNPNEWLTIAGTLSDNYVNLKINGIYETNTPLDDEIIVPLYVGQWLRNVNYNTATIIRIKIDTTITQNQVIEALTQNQTQQTPSHNTQNPTPIQEIIPFTSTLFDPEKLDSKQSQEFMQTYLNKFGITPETLIILSSAIFILASATIFMATRTLISQHIHEINILKAIGATRRTIQIDLILKTLPVTVITSITGLTLGYIIIKIIQEIAKPQILSHTIQFQPEILVILTNIVLTTTIGAIAIIRSTRRLKFK